MKYPCGLIKDLLPLYIDDVCNEESKQAVKTHLKECSQCRQDYESMKSTGTFTANLNDSLEDGKMADSLKKVKSRINKKITVCSVAAVLVFITLFQILFNTAIKMVDISEVAVSAKVYSLEELAEESLSTNISSTAVTIFSDEDDKSETVTLTIPEVATVLLSKDTIVKNNYVTVLSICSNYFLREIEQEVKDDTLYISAFKTTLLNNKSENYQKTMTSLEFREINQIVFIDHNGNETILWKK